MGLGAGKVKLLPSSINGRHLKMIGKSSILTGVQSMRASLGWLQLDRYLASNFTDYLYDSALAQASLKTEHGSSFIVLATELRASCSQPKQQFTDKLPLQQLSTIHYLVELQTNLREDFTITEKAPNILLQFILLRHYAKHPLWNLRERLFEALLCSVPLSGLPPQLNI